jgi:hypothetical protein
MPTADLKILRVQNLDATILNLLKHISPGTFDDLADGAHSIGIND